MLNDLPLDTPYAFYWNAASVTGFAGPDDWQPWADQLISVWDSPALWILNMSLAKDIDSLRSAIWERRRQENGANHDKSRIANQGALGYLYLLKKDSPEVLYEFLKDAGIAADMCSVGMDPEEPYGILNELEKTHDLLTAEKKTHELFEPFLEAAMNQWGTLQAALKLYPKSKYRTPCDWW
ncbi:hypothetical protein Pla110_36270 [Polystyrenella longa]|uniref:Uncharacterized protein n=1 Tax=Polystyrenella longa TaxID=2528007 RepID=A0A518CRL8_9PLAN|nr:hypothetical protein [Polystyrenella longa]QDU81876.1 hypothetical protein Pla110_36270 [Polystyrenella longa]